jgi:hypothetical protein
MPRERQRSTNTDTSVFTPEAKTSAQLYLLDFEALLSRVGSCVGLGGLGLKRSIGHFNISHVDR